MHDLVKKGIICAGLLALGYQGVKFVGRNIFRDVSNDALKRITTDLYDENMWEMVSSTMSVVDVNRDDLFALDELTAKGLGVPVCYEDCR